MPLCRLLTTFDVLNACYNIPLNTMILRAFGFGTRARQWVPTAVLLTLLIAQLLLLALRPATYRRHRTKIALFNRIVRLALLTLMAMVQSPGLLDIMRQQHRSAAAGSQRSSWLVFVRKVLGPPLVYMGHANNVLPFQWVLPMQLYMLFVTGVSVSRSGACTLAVSASNAEMAAIVCSYAKQVVFYMSRVVGRMPSGPALAAAAAEDTCHGVAAVLLLLYVHVVMTLIVPLVIMFRVELSMKADFVRLRGGCVPQALQSLNSDGAMALIAYTLLVGGWCLCESAVAWLGPVACSDNGGVLLLSR